MANPLDRNDVMDSESSDKGGFNDEEGSDAGDTNTDAEGLTVGDTTTHNSNSLMAMSETQALMRSKIAVVACLAVTALLVAGLAYYFSHDAETTGFEQQFDDYARSIEELVHLEARKVFLAVDTMSHTVTSYTDAADKTWPYIDIPNFEIRGDDVIKTASVASVAFCPLVNEAERDPYEVFTTYNQDWIADGIEYSTGQPAPEDMKGVPSKIYRWSNATNGQHRPMVEDGPGPFLPLWQTAPAPNEQVINFNLLSSLPFVEAFDTMMFEKTTFLSKPMPRNEMALVSPTSHGDVAQSDLPFSIVLGPVYDNFSDEAHVVGTVSAMLDWTSFLGSFLSVDKHPVVVTVKGACDDMIMSFQIQGHMVEFLGYEDAHNNDYTYLERSTVLYPTMSNSSSTSASKCPYEVRIYPTKELEDAYRTPQPFLYAAGMLIVFALAAGVFLIYDIYVRERQEKVMESAAKSAAIVHSLFPKNVTDRMMKDLEAQGGGKGKDNGRFSFSAKSQMKDFLQDDGTKNTNPVAVYDTKPIADLFPACTVLFGDIVGFTAWSSVREPTQVFVLLETLYASFDSIAKRRRIFKVETIGDCYVAVSGLPEPRIDHASALCRFARDIQMVMSTLCKDLENTLGPDTGDLAMRVGLHSGPVTAGVLRGDKSRFQLFGDTVNTAARMESTGTRDRIHLSAETAEELRINGKESWTKPREDKIHAKGKGDLDTFWLVAPRRTSCVESAPTNNNESSNESEALDGSGNVTHEASKPVITEHKYDDDAAKLVERTLRKPKPLPQKLQRLVRWNADVLNRLLKQIVARRTAVKAQQGLSGMQNKIMKQTSPSSNESGTAGTVIDEVKDILTLPKFNAKAARDQQDPRTVQLEKEATEQLHNYVAVIASLYRNEVPFHNFEHASHVTMSVVKMLSRVVSPDEVLSAQNNDENAMQRNLHDHTYGITSDPLTQFAVVLSALVHDVDHTGVPNATLVKEGSHIAKIYGGKSVAEQNSVDIALDLLMDESFDQLRATIYDSEEESKRFRQIVVNTVMATDIVDRDLKTLRNARWEKAFQHKVLHEADAIQEDVNRKATIVIEHLIQASDVAHTMQHWHIYRKWNENFFFENLNAYYQGRLEKDPTEFWYKGEMGFFDFYIIPLAKKLKECGVFGVSCDEYLNYAVANRKEWENRGEDAVAEMVDKYNSLYRKEEEEEESVVAPVVVPALEENKVAPTTVPVEEKKVETQESEEKKADD